MFPKIGGKTPKWMVKIMENPIKIDDLGGNTPIFGNTHMENGGCQTEKGPLHVQSFGRWVWNVVFVHTRFLVDILQICNLFVIYRYVSPGPVFLAFAGLEGVLNPDSHFFTRVGKPQANALPQGDG